ncbi:hypothetical protein DOY81_000793, partial [Sarcophaga bullata]
LKECAVNTKMCAKIEHNAFIFNWVENYTDQVNVLKTTLEKLKNKVKVYDHLTKKALLDVIDHLRTSKFETLFDYIVVVILDNKSPSEYYIETSDNEWVLINSEFLTKIQQNPTLKGQPRLFIIQKLFDAYDMDDAISHTITEAIKKQHAKKPTEATKHDKIKYLGLTVTIKGMETRSDFTRSPFIKVFAEHFERETERKQTKIDKIISAIRNDIKNVYGYEYIDVQMETNARSEDLEGTFGIAFPDDISRDFS